MTPLPNISIIGPGKVGTAIGILAAKASIEVSAVAGRTAQSAAAAAKAIAAGVRPCSPGEAASAATLVLLTVPDDAIGRLCGELAAEKAFRPGAIVAHCSGALSSGVLSSARGACGCLIGSMHPLQTFPTVEAAVEKLPGAYFFIEGDAAAAETLEALASAIGAKAVRIEPEAKSLYHAAAVMACNYLTALLDAAGRLAEQAGIDPRTHLSALEPLVRATVENVFAMGPAAALTGPIERGDAETLRRHLDAMRDCDEDIKAAFRAMGRLTVDLARRKGSIRPLEAEKLTELLNR
ncbi:MAG: Rossmann-like and DUF2520 domain-containing protein [Planctomycetota bacterium]|jgi:predicted short-subunit dehydrogenase-like oxidoreductase (DUF2520 family)